MRRHVIMAAVVVLVLGGLAQADQWKKNYQVSGTPELRLDAADGNIEVASWDRSEIQAQVFTEGWRIGPGEVRISEQQSGNRVDIQLRIPHMRWSFGRRSIRIELMVPRQARLDLHTGDGNIIADALKGETRLSTGDGNIDGRRVDGIVKARTGDGNIRLTGRFELLDLHTGDGTIEADALAGSKMTAEWLLRTGDGNIILRLPDGFSADLDAHTGDGRVSADLPVTVSGSVGQGRLRGKLNAGGPILELSTGDGNISLRRS